MLKHVKNIVKLMSVVILKFVSWLLLSRPYLIYQDLTLLFAVVNFFLPLASFLVLFLHVFSPVIVGEENKDNKGNKDAKAGKQKGSTKAVTAGPRGPGKCVWPCLTIPLLLFLVYF